MKNLCTKYMQLLILMKYSVLLFCPLYLIRCAELIFCSDLSAV